MVFQNIELSRIVNATTNPREVFADIEELAASMAAQGLLQPITVRLLPMVKGQEQGLFEIIAGHRRAAAARLLEWHDVPSIIDEGSPIADAEMIEKHLVENIQRDNLKPYELALSIGSLLKMRKRGGQKKLAKNLGKSPAWVSKLKTIADALPSPVPDALKQIGDIDKLYAWAVKSKEQAKEPTEDEEAAAKTAAAKLDNINAAIVETLDMTGPKAVKAAYGKDGGFVVTLTFASETEMREKLGLALDDGDDGQENIDL